MLGGVPSDSDVGMHSLPTECDHGHLRRVSINHFWTAPMDGPSCWPLDIKIFLFPLSFSFSFLSSSSLSIVQLNTIGKTIRLSFIFTPLPARNMVRLFGRYLFPCPLRQTLRRAWRVLTCQPAHEPEEYEFMGAQVSEGSQRINVRIDLRPPMPMCVPLMVPSYCDEETLAFIRNWL